jgi:hypothetical protein
MNPLKVSKVFEFKVYTEKELETVLNHVLRKNTLSETTKKQISKKLSQWVSYLDLKTLNNLLYNPANSIQALHNSPKIKHSPTNHHIYISSVVAYIKYVTKKDELFKNWKEIERKNSEPLAEHYDKNEPSALQKNKDMSLAELHKIRESLEMGSFERLLIAFYTLIEPVRADYYATELLKPDASGGLKDSAEDNYIILYDTTAQLIVKDFKTKRKYQKIENTLPPLLLDELHASLKKYPRDYLFVMDDKKTPFTRKLFSNWACRTLSRVVGKDMTLTALRHNYITDKMHSTSAAEMVDVAKKMGHSRAMQRVYEWQQPISGV